MIFDPVDFLHSFAKWIVARAAALTPELDIIYRGNPTYADNAQLWIFSISETNGKPADPYTVLRIYGGPGLDQPAKRTNQIYVQAQTIGRFDAAACQASYNVFRSIFAADSRDVAGTNGGEGAPVRMLSIAGYAFADDSSDGTYMLVGVDAKQQPGMTGRDPKDRSIWTFNMEIDAQR